MNKTLLLAGVASALFAFNANAMDFNQYVSAKGAFIKMKNDAGVNSHYSFSGKNHHYNKILDNNHKDDVWGIRLAYGAATPVKYGKLRGELEFGWNEDAKDSSTNAFKVITPATVNATTETSVYSAMLNVYYDIETGTKFTPYVGAGLGYARVESKASLPDNGVSTKSSDNNLAWQIGAGVSYAMTDNISFDAGYRYTDYGNVKDSGQINVAPFKKPFDVSSKYDVTSHEFLLGARYSF